MICVVKDGMEVPNKSWVYNGLLVGVEYAQESSFLKGAREPGGDWPVGAD